MSLTLTVALTEIRDTKVLTYLYLDERGPATNALIAQAIGRSERQVRAVREGAEKLLRQQQALDLISSSHGSPKEEPGETSPQDEAPGRIPPVETVDKTQPPKSPQPKKTHDLWPVDNMIWQELDRRGVNKTTAAKAILKYGNGEMERLIWLCDYYKAGRSPFHKVTHEGAWLGKAVQNPEGYWMTDEQRREFEWHRAGLTPEEASPRPADHTVEAPVEYVEAYQESPSEAARLSAKAYQYGLDMATGTLNKSKAQYLAKSNGVPWEMVWRCYTLMTQGVAS